jgi:predicted RNase H-like HicB family nuclease
VTRNVSVVIERDEHGCYAWCPELKGCQSQGKTVEETLSNICEAIELFLETLTDDERSAALSREILTTAVEVHA